MEDVIYLLGIICSLSLSKWTILWGLFSIIALQESKVRRILGTKTAKLLQVRELYGNVITSRKGKFNFQEEYQKTQASQPMVC